jgi:branched-chain amino acid transport system permease protein
MIPSRVWALAALVALAAAPWIVARHQLSLLTDLLIAGLFALSLDLIMGYTGMVSFGHAAYFGLGAYASALVLLHFGQPLPIALLAGAVLAGAVAVPVGWFSTRATGIYFAMLTLAFAQFLYTVAYKWRDLTGGSDGIAGVPKTALFWGGPSLASPHAFYFVVVSCVVLSLVLCRAVVGSPFGRALQAIRDNEARAQFVGIPIWRYRWVAFMLSGVFTGIAGALWVPLNGLTTPDILHWTFSGKIVFMAVLGGFRTFVGPLVGAVVYNYLESYAVGYTVYWQLFLGVILVVLVLSLPTGIVGTAERLLGRRRDAAQPQEATR